MQYSSQHMLSETIDHLTETGFVSMVEQSLDHQQLELDLTNSHLPTLEDIELNPNLQVSLHYIILYVFIASTRL